MFAARRDYILNSSLNWARNPQPLHHMYVLVFLVFLKTKKKKWKATLCSPNITIRFECTPKRAKDRERESHSFKQEIGRLELLVNDGRNCRVRYVLPGIGAKPPISFDTTNWIGQLTDSPSTIQDEWDVINTHTPTGHQYIAMFRAWLVKLLTEKTAVN